MMMDEKWKLSKSFSTRNSCSTTNASSCSSSSSNNHFTRSFSTKSNASNSNTTPSSHSNSPLLRKSSSLKYGAGNGSAGGGGSGRFLHKGSSISRKCSNLAKEQKARFYIMRRCVAMLVCWHKHGDP